MRLIKRLFDFYINSSAHVALSVFSLTWITLIEYGFLYDGKLLCFVFFASVTGYNFVKYFGIVRFHYRSTANWLKAIQVFSFFCFIAMCYYALQLDENTLVFVAVLGVITFFYAIPFLPNHLFLDKHKNLRSIGGLKIYLIALVWSGATVFLPLLDKGYGVDANVAITGLQRFVFIIVLMLPFEIRDLRYDSLKLSTIPQKIGVKQTKVMGVLMLVLFFVLELFKDEIKVENVIVLLVITFVTALLLVFSKTEQRTYYSAFWVEGVPVLWLALLLLAG